MAIPTRKGVHFNGPIRNKVQSRNDRAWQSDLPVGWGPEACEYFNDFLMTQDYNANDWTINTTEAGTSSATEAIAADEKYGALVITNDDADNDVDNLQLNEENWILESGKQVWFESRVKVNDADQVDMFVGLAITDTSARDASDRVGFALADESAALTVENAKDSTATSTASVATIADNTYVVLGFHWDGQSKIEYFVNRALVATHRANIPDDENLAVTINLQNGSAGAKSITIDYIYVAQER